MTNLKKIGLTALAGSLVATSAFAGALSVSGGAKISHTTKGGNEDGITAATSQGSPFGLQKSIGFSGSGELDNGHTVSLYHGTAGGGSHSSSILTYDMGDAGSIVYHDTSAALGIAKIDDMMPTADEEIWNGVGGTPVGRTNGPGTGFNYTNTSMDGVRVDIGYGPKSTGNESDDGGTSGAGGFKSASSIAIQYTGIEGANIFIGTGSKGATAGNETDLDTYGFTYTMGSITVGAQRSETDVTGTADQEKDAYGIAFAVNDNLSISYGASETSEVGATLDQELSGFSVGYSMGGISIKAHSNKGENVSNIANAEHEHTEIAVSFAF
jgi:outer membrane protein OmpU